MGSEVLVPEPNDWKTEFPQLRLAQPIHIAMPCCGIDGAGWSLRAMGVPFTPNNVYDLETRYKEYWQGMVEEGSPLHFGKHNGDIVQVQLSDLERPVHVLCSGPPCPPWAGNGNKKGVEDFRAKAFLAIVNIVASLAKCGELQAAILENVQGILHRQGGEESFMSKLLHILQEEVQEFLWQVDTLKAVDYKLAQDRTRVFLRGIRSTLCPSGAVPPPLPPFGHRVLTDFLASMPCVDRKKLTKCMAQNLKDSQEQLRKLLQEGRLVETDVVCFPLDRADGKTYKRHISVNRTPTLTTSNSYLFVSDMKVGLPDQKRTHFRFLHPHERFVLQGFNVEVAEQFASSQALQVKAAGNAYPVPLIGAAMAPLLAAFGKLPRKEKGSWSSPRVSMSVWLTPCTVLGRKANQRRQDIRCSNDRLHTNHQTNLQTKNWTKPILGPMTRSNMTVMGHSLWVKNVRGLPPRSDLPARQASEGPVRNQDSLPHGACVAFFLPQALTPAECARLACTIIPVLKQGSPAAMRNHDGSTTCAKNNNLQVLPPRSPLHSHRWAKIA